MTINNSATFAITSLQGASTISGNSHLVRLGDAYLLLDLGLNVNVPIAQAYQNWKHNLLRALPEGSRDMNRLFAILVSHAHTDHVGLLPMLYRDPDLAQLKTSAGSKPKVRIIANDSTRELASVMLRDMARMYAEDETRGFSEANVTGMLRAIDPYPEDGRLHTFRDMGQVRTWHAGHILGSQMLLLEHQDMRVMFSGDINTLHQATIDPVLCPPGPIDVLIMEHTYGIEADRLQVSREEQEEEFIAALDGVLRRGGSVLVPAFAIGRAQEVLCLVAEHAQDHPNIYYDVYLDGLARSIASVYDVYQRETTTRYQEARSWIDRRLTVVGGEEERNAVIEAIRHRPGVIVASSGMLKAGSASHYYARAIAGNSEDAIFLTGYMAEDSEAALIYTAKQDALEQLGIDVRCEVRHFHFTAHAPRTGLLDFVAELNPRSILLVHGNAERSRSDPASVYNILLGEGLDVQLGQENVPFTYRGGRLITA